MPTSSSSSNNDKIPSPFEVLLNKKNGSNSDCDRPACEDTVSALTNALNRLNEKKKNIGSTTTTTTNTAVSCPPSKDRIGSSSWTLLHSMVSE